MTKDEIQAVLDGATPGPWKVTYERGCTFLDTPKGKTMCDETYYPWVPENPKDWELIAMAPDLARRVLELEEVLRGFADWYDDTHPIRTADVHFASCTCPRCLRDRARALLKEARDD